MNKELEIKEFLPKLPIPVEYLVTHCPSYVVDCGYVFGVEKNGTCQQVDNTKKLDDRFSGLLKVSEISDTDFNWLYRYKHYCYNLQCENHGMNKPVYDENGQELLVHMLRAGKRALENQVSKNMEIDLIEANDMLVSDILLPLCEKYGLLSVQNSVLPISSESHDEKKLEESLNYGFNWIKAAVALSHLYLVYLCWKSLEWPEAVSAEEKALTNDGLKYSYMAGAPKDNYTLDDCRGAISWFSLGNTGTTTIQYDNSGKQRIVVRYKNVVQAAKGLLTTIIGMGERARERGTFVCCEKCGMPFIRYHGRKKFCSDCGTNTELVRDSRKRKKEALQNGQATE